MKNLPKTQKPEAMRSNFSSSSLLLLVFFTFLCFALSSQDLIAETCKKSAQTDANINETFCITSLQAYPKVNPSDLRQLGFISIKLIQANVTRTRKSIKTTLKKGKTKDPFVVSCLKDCLELYSDSIQTTKQVAREYKLKSYPDVNIHLSSVMDSTTTCEDGFKEKQGVVSPLTAKNNNTFQLTAIALSITNMLSTGKSTVG